MATSRARLMEKLQTVDFFFCEQYGMLMNQKKTKLMVINGQKEDRLPIELTGSTIGHTTHCVYLGALFTEDGKMASMMKPQLEACRKHVNKFAAFVQKNCNMPFTFKHKVALSASMLYSCESWLTDNTSGREGMGQRLTDAAETVGDPELASLESIRRQCRQKAADGATRYQTYLEMNPDLCVHPIYENKEEYVPDSRRIAATRLRLSSHRLLVETGRWSRIPRENRVCASDATFVQDETHVMLYCARTAYLIALLTPPLKSVADVFALSNNATNANLCQDILNVFY
ncbi:hypothetical protein CAPTEDRAFT_204841 [Capitella teleta]|uniref:Reverse transcriptase domain-containing protein n=1 Tax=Capitella teleta TaxID=283909 RepID=R7UZP8_CAPTE|nr:hypothetical protein CAPTEDRAFT_204841 [Capitella teleta]|eukprot:ELU11764.1 hypothetical protein CAPTEDRAFT_204841 [Capitella teleta]